MALEENNHQLIEEAANWIVQLSVDDEKSRQIASLKFEAWKKISPRHYQIATDIEQCIGSIQNIAKSTPHKKVAKVALKAGLYSGKYSKSLRTGSLFAFTFISITASLFYLTHHSIAFITADVQSQSGQWIVKTLPDGSQLILTGKSAVNLDYKEHERVIKLIQGQIYVNVAKDKARPFLVETNHGTIQALGTAFSVTYDPSFTELKMLHSKVKVQATHLESKNQNGLSQSIVSQGEAVKIDYSGITKITAINIYNEQQKWQKHQLMVEDVPLDQVLEELDKNYKGKIWFSKAALKHIRVNAVLPLDQPDQSLQLLGNVFPDLRIKHITPYLVIISL